jgi:hypothetical protein
MVAALLVAVAVAGCDGSEDERESPPPPPPAPRETVHHVPRLPDDFRREVNRAGGFGLGVPRGWKVGDRGSGSLIRSFDRLVATSIVADRTRAAQQVPVNEYATRAAEALPGYRGGLRLQRPQHFPHRYHGVEVGAVGTAKGGIDQRVSVIVLRRDQLVTFTIVLAKNAKQATGPSKRLAERVIDTLRSRPPGGRGGHGER